MESKTNFFRAVRAGYVEATSRPLHVGHTLIVTETDLRDTSNGLVGGTLQSQLVFGAA